MPPFRLDRRTLARLRRLGITTFLASLLLAAGLGSAVLFFVRVSLPDDEGTHRIPGLGEKVTVGFDALGIPSIEARSRADAFAALGYVTARDRLFQMDLLRRAPAGRLAEIFGKSELDDDRRSRIMGFSGVARSVLERLPREQRSVLEAYAAGVNRAMEDARWLPVEFLLLGYTPEPWRPEDSLLVILGVEQNLSWGGDQERMATVMQRALPPEAVRFFTPESDCYNEALAPLDPSRCAPGAVPLQALQKVLAETAVRHAAGLVSGSPPPRGSNGWVVGPAKTKTGRAMLANDMHLELAVPDIWYRAALHYEPRQLYGLTLPGVPLLITGSNGNVAWGFTNIEGDFTDLVTIETEPNHPESYRTPQGLRAFGTRTEFIAVRGGEAETLQVKETVWGPVMPEKLLGRPVAVHWTALDPAATNLDLLDMDRVENVAGAIGLLQRAGGPSLNALLADADGRIGWTYMGKLPKRFGMDGLFSESWADGTKGWDGYLSPEEIPSIIDPQPGFLVNTNQRMLGASFGRVLGHDYSGGHRAWRATQRLQGPDEMDERGMLDVQLDTGADFYRYYQTLAFNLLAGGKELGSHKTALVRAALAAWDGKAETSSLGLALLVEFRNRLIDTVIGPFMVRCRGLDPDFVYGWINVDVPLQQLISARRPDLLPARAGFRDWDELLRSALHDAVQSLAERFGEDGIASLPWGEVNRLTMRHPLSDGIPFLGSLLDMPAEALPGCGACVRLAEGHWGATGRMVVAPGAEGAGILHIPGGQSGQPGSPHYADQQRDWLEGLPTPFLPGATHQRVNLLP